MPTIDEAKTRAALQALRHELKHLKVCEPGSPQWDRQRIAVENAGASYRKAANEYTEMLIKADRPNQGAA